MEPESGARASATGQAWPMRSQLPPNPGRRRAKSSAIGASRVRVVISTKVSYGRS
jgi:hypothetical protein